MRVLYDSELPHNLSAEAPAGVVLDRWTGGVVTDMELVRIAADRGYDGVLFYGRDFLVQPGLQEVAAEVDVTLVAVEAEDPIAAKLRVQWYCERLRKMVGTHRCVLILASGPRPYLP